MSAPPRPPMPPGAMPPMPPGMSRPGPPMPPGMKAMPPVSGTPPPRPPPVGGAAPGFRPPPLPPGRPQEHASIYEDRPGAGRYLQPPGAAVEAPPRVERDYHGAPGGYSSYERPPAPPGGPSAYDRPSRPDRYGGGGGAPYERQDRYAGGGGGAPYDRPDRYGGGGSGAPYERPDRYGGGAPYERPDRYGGGGGAPYDRPSRYEPHGERGGAPYDRYGGRGGGAPFRSYPPRGDYPGGGRREEGGGGGGSGMPLRDPTNTVWVGSLDTAIHTDEALYDAFGLYGRVMRIAKHPDRGYCFVHFRRVEEARTAVDELTINRRLGPAVFNYGKMFEYTEEEMNMSYDANERAPPPPPPRHQRDEYDPDRPARRPRVEREPMEPTNVLWVGSLPSYITDEKLREVFEVFGDITNISRMERSNIAFVHFDTEEHCTMALQRMTGRPIEGGVILALNYGVPQRPRGNGMDASADGGIPPNEMPTNVVYLGMLPANITDADVENLFAPYEGFINSKYVPTANIGFGHFDTVEHAREARVALNNVKVSGTPIRVSFGKNNHNYTMADRYGGDVGMMHNNGGEFSLDAMMRAPDGMDGASGALVLGNAAGGGMMQMALTLPQMGDQRGAMTLLPGMTLFDRERIPPSLTLDARLQSVLGTTYNSCGDKGLELSPSQVQAICSMVDLCIDASTGKQLDDTLVLYSPLKSAHVFNIIAKRLHDCFNNDPHKKLLVLYAVTRVLLGAVTDYISFSEASVNAYLTVLLVCSTNQTSSGMDRLSAIIESLMNHPFLDEKTKVQDAYKEDYREQIKEILNRAKTEQDVASLLVKRKRRRD